MSLSPHTVLIRLVYLRSRKQTSGFQMLGVEGGEVVEGSLDMQTFSYRE